MILEFLFDHGDDLDPGLTLDALDRNEAVIGEHGPPFDVTASQVQAVFASSLLSSARENGGRRIGDRVVRRIEEIREPQAAEYARLISKGRLLFEHCMTEVSHACVIGFIDHELKKSRACERVMFDLMGWMVEQRIELAELAEDEGEEAVRRCAHADYMIDHAVSLLHGLDRGTATELASDKEPD